MNPTGHRSALAAPTAPPVAPDAPVDAALAHMQQVYERLEPAGQDTWNPVGDDVELWHRARLLHEACRLLRLLPKPLHTIKVLDVGCGVGRSARLLVDLGVQPGNLIAIDLRPAALDVARASNPAIDWRLVSGLDDWPEDPFDLVGSSRVDLQACKLEYSIVSPK